METLLMSLVGVANLVLITAYFRMLFGDFDIKNVGLNAAKINKQVAEMNLEAAKLNLRAEELRYQRTHS